MIGETVLVRQQPASPPPNPQVLVLADHMAERCSPSDKYLKVTAMVGYTLRNYTQDIRDGFIGMQFPYVVVFMGTMQLGVFDA